MTCFTDLLCKRSAIDEGVRSVKRAAFRPGTRKNLQTQLDTYLHFCAYYQYQPFPCDSEILCQYAFFLSKSFDSTASVKNYISGVKSFSKLLGHDISAFDSVDLKLTIQGISKVCLHMPKSKLPLSYSDLRLMIQFLDTSKPLQACMWVFLTFAFFGMLRASNLLCVSLKSFKSSEQLIRCNVHFVSEGLNLYISWSKTRQTHDFLHILPLGKCHDILLCPVRAYYNLLHVIPADAMSPVMGIPNCKSKHKLVPVTKHQLVSLFKTLLLKCHLDPSFYSLHSLRHGGATLAAKAGVSELMLKTHGDWRSDSYQTYIKNAKVSSFAVTNDMYALLKLN